MASTNFLELGRNTLVSLSGVLATVAIGHVMFAASISDLDRPNLPLGLLFATLLYLPSLGIGLFASRLPALQSALAYFVGSTIVTAMDYAPLVYPDTHTFPRAEWLAICANNSHSRRLPAYSAIWEPGSEDA
jgi:hypothetical protein